VLLAIFSFFGFIEELEDIGRGRYTLGLAAVVVLLSLPGLAYELLPIAALLGSLLSLGAMSERNEIAVVRCAGVSKLRVVWSVMKTGLVFVVFAVVVGEVVFPPADRKANAVRSHAISDRVGSASENGFWARDGSNYINIYEYDEADRLRTSTHAQSAHYIEGRWELRDISQTRFEATGPVSELMKRASWDSVLDPDIIGMIAITPESLSSLALVRYVEFARDNGQSAQRWEHALWTKIGYPMATAVMVFLAIPLVLGANARSGSAGRRILLGALIGLTFHVLNQASGHLGVVFSVPATVSALGPTLLLLTVGLVLNARRS
jgi:lipopolysaccharide export system permease protein